MPDEIIILVTCPASEAEGIATTLVDERLIACANLVPGVISIYRWQEKLCTDNETLLIMKSRRAVWTALEKRIKELHTYEVPEILSLSIEAGYQPYLEWLNRQIDRNALSDAEQGRAKGA